ncbi:hypothetical protein GCM10020000_44720 [Streptomyces olivoverticillatus]
MAFRGTGPEAADHGREPLAMNGVLWILFVPTAALGLAAWKLPHWFDGRPLTPTLTTSLLSTGCALAGAAVTYAAWRRTSVLTARTPLGAVAADPDAAPRRLRGRGHRQPHPRLRPHRLRPGPGRPRQAAARPPAPPRRHRLPPGRRLLGALRPARARRRPPRRLPRPRGRRDVRTRRGQRPRLLGTAVRRAQTGNVQTYLGALLAGSVVLAVAAVLVATGA